MPENWNLKLAESMQRFNAAAERAGVPERFPQSAIDRCIADAQPPKPKSRFRRVWEALTD